MKPICCSTVCRYQHSRGKIYTRPIISYAGEQIRRQLTAIEFSAFVIGTGTSCHEAHFAWSTGGLTQRQLLLTGASTVVRPPIKNFPQGTGLEPHLCGIYTPIDRSSKDHLLCWEAHCYSVGATFPRPGLMATWLHAISC